MSEPQPPKAPEASKKSFPPATTAMSALDLMTAEAEARARREGRTQPPGSRLHAGKGSNADHLVNRIEDPPAANGAPSRAPATRQRPATKPVARATPWWVWVLVVAALAAVAWLVLAR